MATAATAVLTLFSRNEFTDVTFEVKCGSGWSSFPAHRLILSLWSPVLAKKFQNNTNAFDGKIEIRDIRPSVFDVFLKYLYNSTQELEKNKRDVDFVLDLYRAASKYQVQKLKIECCETLNSSSPNEANVLQLIDAAVLINSNCLKERCYGVLQSKTELIFNSQDLQSVTPSMVITLLQLPSLWLSSEYELLTWVFKWAKSYCSKENINNHREIINPFLPYLNFTVLSCEKFAILVKDYREFFDEVECFNIFMNINLPESSELPVWHNTSTNTRRYEKFTQETESVLFGDFAPELGYSVNNLTSNNSDICNYNVSSTLSDDTSSTSPTVDEEVATVDVATNTETVVGIGSVNCNASTINVCCKASQPTVDKMTLTDLAMDTNNEEVTSSNGNGAFVPLGTETSTISNEIEGIDTIGNEIEETERIGNEIEETERMENEIKETEKLGNEIKETEKLGNEIEETERMGNETEETERGQENASVLEIIDQEPGKSWESLEPPMHLEKIKKKKVLKLYMLPEGRSLPNIGIWDPVFEPSFLSGDFKSLTDIIEKQLCLPIASDITKKRFSFPSDNLPFIC